jgi:hypothetical protein
MTVHVISVGVSVLNVLQDQDKLREKLAGKDELIAAIGRAEPWDLLSRELGVSEPGRDQASQWLSGALGGGNSGQAERFREIAEQVRPREWPLDISAERETFAVVAQKRAFSLESGDVAIFICSDTPPGLLAGAWNALALTGGDPGRVRYIADPASLSGDMHGKAVLVRINGMDAGNSKGFAAAMSGLGILGRQLFAHGELKHAEPFRFYLSGGFKAAIPYLIGLAEGVMSVDKACLSELGVANLMPDAGPYPVTAWVLHESAHQQPGQRSALPPPIRLPLRRLDASWVRRELTRFAGEPPVRRGMPRSALLEGYAYEMTRRARNEDDHEYTLTAFGAGLRELFGVAKEAYGG